VEDQFKTHDQLLGEVMRLRRRVDELERTLQRNRQDERLSAVRAAASGIAHDFNNTISAILGWSELMLIRPEILDDRDKVMRHLQTIKTAALDAASVVRRLRRFYRRRGENEPFEPVPINDLVEQAALLTQPKWQDDRSDHESIRLVSDLHPVPPLLGNESELREMLTNLIHNAVEAMPDGGTITVRTSLRETDDGPRVVVEVEDTGSGMTDEIRQRCMEPFFSTKGERGTGLGLPMVYGIVRRHEGTIDIDSRLMAGTIVTIRIPAHPEQKPGVSGEKSPAQPRSLRVLIVEDDPAVSEVLIEYLTNDGHTFEAAYDGGERATGAGGQACRTRQAGDPADGGLLRGQGTGGRATPGDRRHRRQAHHPDRIPGSAGPGDLTVSGTRAHRPKPAGLPRGRAGSRLCSGDWYNIRTAISVRSTRKGPTSDVQPGRDAPAAA
jgi:nitrogen-specific signal transduction histidine kinase